MSLVSLISVHELNMERWSRSVAEVVAIVGRWPEGGQFSTKIARHGPSRVASVTRKILHTSAYVRLVSSISVHELGRKRSLCSVAAVVAIGGWWTEGSVFAEKRLFRLPSDHRPPMATTGGGDGGGGEGSGGDGGGAVVADAIGRLD